MIQQDVVMVVTSDIAGQVRGKGFPAANLEKRMTRGVGWVPTNVQITCFNGIADSPFGSFGDLILVPDPDAGVCVDFEDNGPAEHFYIGDIRHLDGSPWECCTRSMAKRALADLEREAGLLFFSAFEHEFFYSGADATAWNGFGLDGFRENAAFIRTFAAALEKAGVDTDTLLPEYGPGQFEATIHPATGIRSADQSLVLREMARAAAARFGERVSFSPVVTPESVGNGVHIHFSLLDRDGNPVTHDANAPYGLGNTAGMFCAGILKYMPAITVLTAPSPISYQRLVPHRWSAAFNNLAHRDREAGLRICPVIEKEGFKPDSQYNLEYRAADAAASPYLQLAALVRAGLQGIRDGLQPPGVTQEDLSLLSADQLAERGIRRLPQSLADALTMFENEPVMAAWFGRTFTDIYLAHKRQEAIDAGQIPEEEIYEAYSRRY